MIQNKYLDELFLHTGQYAIFYIFMNLSLGFGHFFGDAGHFVLFISLVFQIFLSVHYINNPYKRALSFFFLPLFYTIYDGFGNNDWIYNIGHSFFWIFSFLVAFLVLIKYRIANQHIKVLSEGLIVFLNIAIFIAVYFYFDLKLSQTELYELGKIDAHDLKESLEIYNIISSLGIFVEDPAHIYIIFGGLFLGLAITYNRIENLQLTQKIDTLLDTYLDISIKERLLNGEQEATKKELVILFCDIRNFTNISEKYEATKIVETLNVYYSFWADEVVKHNGIINKFIGDAVMVIFGLDGSKEKAIKESVNLSLTMLEKLPQINAILISKQLPTLDEIGIGIHCGEVVLGAIGGTERKDYTVIGDNVNIASRLESLCKIYKNNLIVSSQIYENCGDLEERFLLLDTIALKGKTTAHTIYGKREF
ncbi:MAG: adenylate/guanylate cyclase domain-containing protein [Arcobacteraceae bacterium]|jgi:class 3 adenylate cyclase|nr:adenylate/guanylate cyclase domain-containing protein [Arcobacteraceae bacterium]